MAKQYRIIRKIASVPIVANGFALQDLPRAYDYEALFLRIGAVLNVTTGATSVRAEAPAQLVSRIEVIADGKNTLYNAPFWHASLGSFQRNLLQSGARATTPPTAASAAAYTVEAIGVVDFMNVGGLRPKDTNFRTRNLSLFQLRLTFGAEISSFVPGSGVVAFTGSPVVDVFSAELVEETDANGMFIKNPSALKKISWVRGAAASSNSALQQRLPAGNLIASVLLRGEGTTTAGEPSAAFNNVKLQSGTDVRLNLAAAMLRAKNNADYGALTAGYYVADILAKGKAPRSLSELWDVTQQAEPVAELDITGGANVFYDAVIEEYIFPRAA